MFLAPRRLIDRAVAGARVWPGPRDWAETLLVGAVVGAAGYAVGRRTGLFRPAPRRPQLLDAVAILIAPALGEELVFRGALTPGREEEPDDVAAVALSTAVFTLWHVVEALTFMPGSRRTFLRPDFLALAALEGVACGWLRRRTGSIWPGVLLHWAEVFVWKTWLGGAGQSDRRDTGGAP